MNHGGTHRGWGDSERTSPVPAWLCKLRFFLDGIPSGSSQLSSYEAELLYWK